MMKSNLYKALRCSIMFLVLISLSVSISCDIEWGDPVNENGTSSNGGDPVNENGTSSKGSLEEGSQITVSKVEDIVAQAGATATNVQVIHQDGLDDQQRMDFDTVIMGRATGGMFDNDLVYAYDGIYMGEEKISDLNSSLYLDTDADSNTGDSTLGDGIGAEVRLSNRGSNLSAARFEYDEFLNSWVPSFSGNTNASMTISEDGESINVTIIVTSTDDLLSTQDADAVLILEEIDNDESTVLRRLGRTTPFVIPILKD